MIPATLSDFTQCTGQQYVDLLMFGIVMCRVHTDTSKLSIHINTCKCFLLREPLRKDPQDIITPPVKKSKQQKTGLHRKHQRRNTDIVLLYSVQSGRTKLPKVMSTDVYTVVQTMHLTSNCVSLPRVVLLRQEY